MVGRTPSPPRAVPPPVPATWGTQHTWGGAAARPGLRYSPWGGYPLPPRPGPWLLQCGGCGYARSTSQPRTAAVAARRRPPPGRQRGAPPGRAAPLPSAPLRPVLEGSRVPACLTRQVLGSAARTLEPLTLPLPTPGPAERGVEGSVLGQVCGERGMQKPRVRPACGLAGSVGAPASWVRPRALGMPERERGGWAE